MNIFKILSKKSALFYYILGGLSLLNSVTYAGILMFINDVVERDHTFPFPGYEWAIFLGLIIISLVSHRIFQVYLINLTNQIVFDFETALIQKLRFTSFTVFQKLGTQKIYTGILDARVLASLPEALSNTVNASIILMCGLGYLFVVSPWGGLSILIMIVALVIIYMVRNQAVEKDLNQIRDLQTDYYKFLSDLLDGFKEIKMSITRNENIYTKFLRNNRLKAKELGISSSIRFLNNEILGNYSMYFLLGIIIFLMPKLLYFSPAQTSAYVVTLLYLLGPIAILIIALPFYSRIKIALERLHELEDAFDSEKTEFDEKNNNLAKVKGNFYNLRFENVTYDYFDKEKETVFSLGPINLEISQGEIIFITGGNGSGKSTFINLLTGLNAPTSGNIYLNDIEITRDNYEFYRNSISVIFTNHYQLRENYDGINIRGNEKLNGFIELMKLKGILRVDEDRNWVDDNLSKGQQKRLALILALMEEREIIVLDEWAAEQDPGFRKYFYKHLIPHMKDMGKTIIAVTHDDEYFRCSERLIKFDFGKIASIEQIFDKTEIVTY